MAEWDVLLYYCIANPGEEVDASEEVVRRRGICMEVGAGATFSDAVEAVKRASGVKQVDDVHRLRLTPQRSWVAITPQVSEYVCKKGDEFFFRVIRRGVPHRIEFNWKKAKVDWMQDLVTRIKAPWGSIRLDKEDLLDPLPWPHTPMLNPRVATLSDPLTEDETETEGTSEEDGEDEEPASEEDDTDSKVSTNEMKFVDLGNHTTFSAIWGNKDSGVILERPCYIELYKKVDAMFTTMGRQSVLLLGNPGVGKTAFVLYVLVKLLQNQKKVLLRSKSGALFYFKPDGQGSYEMLDVANTREASLEYDKGIHFLADSKLPDVPDFVGKALLACTPLRSNYKDFEKDGACETFYMPVWSNVELSLLRKKVFPDTDLKEISARYRQWGGIPRYVLEQRDKDLASIICSINAVNKVVDAITSGAEHPSQNVIYMRVVEGFRTYDYMFASPFAKEQLYKHLFLDQLENLKSFLKFRGQAITGFGGLKGGLLKEAFRKKACEGKKYRVREVFEKSTGRGTILEREFKFGMPRSVWTIGDDLMEYDRIIWPSNPIEESIDAFKITRNDAGQSVLQAFQVTVSSKRHAHGIKFKGMSMLMNMFKIPAARTEVYIVTTTELFHFVGWQNWRTKNDEVLKGRTEKKLLEGIRQYGLDADC